MALLGTLDYVCGFVVFARKYRVGGFWSKLGCLHAIYVCGGVAYVSR